MGSDLYQVLGVEKDATEQEIRRAYYRMAKVWHPDVNPARDAKSNFQLINKAYTILSNPLTRHAYDQKKSDPWVAQSRRDYYRYGTSARRPGDGFQSENQAEKQDEIVRNPLLDKVLFGSLLFFGVTGIILGVVDVITTSEEEVLKLTGLLTGIVFTGLLLFGWTTLRREWRGKDRRDGQ